MNKKIPLKNYILLGIVLIITIILAIYVYMWHNAYKENKQNKAIMNEYLQVINYNELDNYLTENKDAVIYCSTLDTKNIKNFEKKFKNVITKHSINNDILYLDLTDEVKDKKIKKDLNEKDITSIPSIVIYRNGSVYSVYDIKANNYNINKLVDYLEKEEIIND